MISIFSDDWVSEDEIRHAMKQTKDLVAHASYVGVNPRYLAEMAAGKVPITPKVARHFGFDQATVYRRLK
jgi:hypothetical protein